ncbi:serine/threonine protein kinase, partial [Actinospica acidiphila]|nr:serine/threonine protein kinase [Actinospica acidiphila]
PAAARSATAASPAAGTPGRTSDGNAASGGRSSGWPVMTPPDLPARPAPRASITDVVPRRTLVVIALVVVLAVIGTVLALTLGGDDESGSGARGAGGDRTAAESTPSAETRKDDEDGTRTDGSATASTGTGGSAAASPDSTGTGGGAGTGGSSDAGNGGAGQTRAATTYRGQQGYSIGLPAGWKYKSSDEAGDRFTGPNGQKLLVGWTTTPKDDPVADWTNQERFMVRPKYKRIRIEAVEYRGWKTADWEFTYVDGGVTYRSVDRGTVVNDGLGYGLMYTARADAWDGEQRTSTWRTLTETFRPKS